MAAWDQIRNTDDPDEITPELIASAAVYECNRLYREHEEEDGKALSLVIRDKRTVPETRASMCRI